MAFFLLLTVAVRVFLSCSAQTAPKNRAKIVEEYVVSAKFDENRNFPQLSDGSRQRGIFYREGEPKKDGSSPPFAGLREGHGVGVSTLVDSDDGDALEERDFAVHHHHLPLAPHPPPPPPPAGLAHAPSLFAVGLITFLILLNSLYTSLLLLKSKGSVLGSVTGALGRKKRFASESGRGFTGEYEETKLNLAWIPKGRRRS